MTDLLETLIENREMVQPNHANMLGTAHGGNVMKWMDEIVLNLLIRACHRIDHRLFYSVVIARYRASSHRGSY